MKSLLKILRSYVILLLVILFATSCSSSNKSVNSNRIIKASTIVKYNDYIYYYNLSHDNKQGLFQYNTKTKEIKEIDSFFFYGDLFLVNDDIYYFCGNENNTFNVRCYDGTNVIDKGVIYDGLTRASGLRYTSEDCQLYIEDDALYVVYNNKIYKRNNDNSFDTIAQDISTCTVDGDDIYYSDSQGGLYLMTKKQEHSVIVNPSEFANIPYVNKILGNYYRITNLIKNDDYLYFLLGNKDTPMGKCFRVSLTNHKIEQIFDEGVTGDISIDNDNLYYYEDGSGKIVCKDLSNNNSNIINVPKDIYGFDVIGDAVYYSVINTDRKSLAYFKFQNGKVKELFQR